MTRGPLRVSMILVDDNVFALVNGCLAVSSNGLVVTNVSIVPNCLILVCGFVIIGLINHFCRRLNVVLVFVIIVVLIVGFAIFFLHNNGLRRRPREEVAEKEV